MDIPKFQKDTLKDVDIEVKIRSGQSDLRNLDNLSQAIVASVRYYLELEMLLTEVDSHQNMAPNKCVTTILRKFHID